MNSGINPYQPTPAVQDTRERLDFDGEIMFADFSLLLARQVGYRALRTFTLVNAALYFAIAGCLVVTLASDPNWFSLLLNLVMFSFVGLAFVFYRRSSTANRAKRVLKANPDLLGDVRGHFGPTGLLLDDGKREHWFGPSRLLSTRISQDGMFVRVDRNPERHLALTARLFDGYDVQLATRLQAQWKQHMRDAREMSAGDGLAIWTKLSPPPADAIFFAGYLNQRLSLRTPQAKRAALLDTAGCIVMIVVAAACFQIDRAFWLTVVLVPIFGLLLVNDIRLWWRYFRGVEEHHWYQQGWISSSELAICIGHGGVRVPLSEFCSWTHSGDIIELARPQGVNNYLARDHFTDSSDWDTLSQRAQATHSADASASTDATTDTFPTPLS